MIAAERASDIQGAAAEQSRRPRDHPRSAETITILSQHLFERSATLLRSTRATRAPTPGLLAPFCAPLPRRICSARRIARRQRYLGAWRALVDATRARR